MQSYIFNMNVRPEWWVYVCNSETGGYMSRGYFAWGVIVQWVYVRGFMSGWYMSGGYLS